MQKLIALLALGALLVFVAGCEKTETSTVNNSSSGSGEMKEVVSDKHQNKAMGTAVEPGTE